MTIALKHLLCPVLILREIGKKITHTKTVTTYVNATNVMNTSTDINADRCVRNVLINTMLPKIGHNGYKYEK
jgi:hypothetical protein